MGIVKFAIVFDQPDKTYYPGQMVTGKVELMINHIMKIRGVELKIKGRAKCKWNEHENYTDSEGKSHTRTVCHKESEVYLKNEIILCGGKDKFELPVGDYSYPFAVMLPYKTPSSFSGSYGDVSYYAKAKVDIPLAVDKTEKQGFTVVNLLNLNNFPNLRDPCKTEKHKTFCCWCCASGPLSIIIHLPKTGYAKTESIPITIEVDNASNVKVNAIHTYLKKNVHWKAQGEHKDESVQLQKLRFGAVDEGQSHTWSENMTIPPTSFPYLDNCGIIKISYVLHVEADASGPHTDLDMHIPLTIGDVPLNEDPNAPVVDLNAQAFSNNVSYPSMQVQPGVIVSNPNPGAYPPGGFPQNPIPGYPTGPGFPYLAICPPGPVPETSYQPPTAGFVQPQVPPTGGMPQLPVQGYPQGNYNPSPQYPPNQPTMPAQPYPAANHNPNNQINNFTLPPQPASNPAFSQNTPLPPTGYNFDPNYGVSQIGNNDIKLEQTTFLSQNEKHDENEATQFTPLLPASPSAPPSN